MEQERGEIEQERSEMERGRAIEEEELHREVERQRRIYMEQPPPMRKHTTETEGTSELTPAPPTRHLAPGGPLNQAAVPV